MSQRGDDRLLPLVADVPRPGTLRAGWPLCTLLAAGAGRHEVLDQLTRRARDLQAALR